MHATDSIAANNDSFFFFFALPMTHFSASFATLKFNGWAVRGVMCAYKARPWLLPHHYYMYLHGCTTEQHAFNGMCGLFFVESFEIAAFTNSLSDGNGKNGEKKLFDLFEWQFIFDLMNGTQGWHLHELPTKQTTVWKMARSLFLFWGRSWVWRETRKKRNETKFNDGRWTLYGWNPKNVRNFDAAIK